MDELFAAVDAALASSDPGETLDLLAREFRAGGRYDLLFEARNMRQRFQLGLPLVQTGPLNLPEDLRPAYEESALAAAREAGELYLAAGDIPAAYRYFRAIGDPAPVAAAIENSDPGEKLEEVIAIAFQEGVHPAKGLELILKNHGMCRAITSFGMYAVEKDRERCMDLLVRELHAEIVERMSRAIEQREGAAPPARTLPELMAGRDWLFGEYDYYVDTSHLTSVIPYCLEVTGKETLRLIDELCQYGARLSSTFAFKGNPPFENGYEDYGHYVKALIGDRREEHIGHFHEKAGNADPETVGSAPAQVLVGLLSRLERHAEALDVFLEYLRDEDPAWLRCPNALQLCYAARDYERMRRIARDRGDVLSYAAAAALSSGKGRA